MFHVFYNKIETRYLILVGLILKSIQDVDFATDPYLSFFGAFNVYTCIW